MKCERKIPARGFRIALELEDAVDLLPLLQMELQRVHWKMETENLDDDAQRQLACKHFRLERICSQIAQAQEKQREAELGREPEFIRAVQEAIENGTL